MIERQKIRYVLRLAAENVAAINALIALAKAKRTLVPPQLIDAWAGAPARSKLPAHGNHGAGNAAGSERKRCKGTAAARGRGR